jgi:hypothetical protein
MNLEELIFIKESLQELEATAEKFNWGPSCEMAEERQKDCVSSGEQSRKPKRMPA